MNAAILVMMVAGDLVVQQFVHYVKSIFQKRKAPLRSNGLQRDKCD